MSQQEFEPRQQSSDEETYQPHYPYTWSGQAQQGMPRDESPGSYRAQTSHYDTLNTAAQVPWWARAQPQRNKSAALVVLMVCIALAIGGLGFLGVVLGSLVHILGAILGVFLAIFLFILLLIFLILALIGRGLSRVFGPPRSSRRAWRDNQRMARRAWRDNQRMARRAWRDNRRMARRAARRDW